MRSYWDIFCSVVDNYGDAGFSWRLACQLVSDYSIPVRLWIDDLETLSRLYPPTDLDAEIQDLNGVKVFIWPNTWTSIKIGETVIEAFACGLPDPIVQQIENAKHPVLWINLEYLTAESWIIQCHKLFSLRIDNLQRMFFFPGFSPEVGGLLRERNLLTQRQDFIGDVNHKKDFLMNFNITFTENTFIISLFSYRSSSLASWLEALSFSKNLVIVLLLSSQIEKDFPQWLRGSDFSLGKNKRQGNLLVKPLPFLSQLDYDRLLWSCDFNIVRGEDSFVRALWSGKPFLWNIYPQNDGAHWSKIEAFLKIYTRKLCTEPRKTLEEFWLCWNLGLSVEKLWSNILLNWKIFKLHAEYWSRKESEKTDLAQSLVLTHKQWLEKKDVCS